MLDLPSLVRAGAILPIGAKLPADERCGDVVAHGYEHPALSESTIVRLSVSDVAEGVDAEMEALGFARTQVVEKLGQQKFRALGFPGWALVHDPKRSRFALEVTRDFKKAKKRVKSKPGHARDAFIEIAERLGRSVPHFLPSFWEEAGRAFIAEDSESFAAQCFEKARLVEKEHKLTIDEDVRSAVYVEFALAGAVAAKSLSGYAKELEKRYGAQAAFERYRELALRRTLGGLPPWLGMGKELRALAREGRRDVAAEEAKFVDEVLESPCMARAPGDFWQLYRPTLVALAKTDAKVRKRLRHLFPKPTAQAEGFAEMWLSLLEEADVFSELLRASSEEPEPEAAAKWLQAVVAFRESHGSLRSYLERFRARLIEAKVPLDLSHGYAWRSSIELSLAEHALALGIALAEPRERSSISLGPLDCDPVRVAADPVLSKLLSAAVAERMGEAQFEAAVVGKQGFEAARRQWLEAQLLKLETGALIAAAEVLEALTKQSTPRLFSEFPEAYARLQRVELGAALSLNLRGGLCAELTWPVWEEAVLELGENEATLSGFFPFPVLHNALKAVALSGQTRRAEHDFVVPAGAEVTSVWWADGQFLVVLRTREGGRAYWSAEPSNLFEFSSYLSSYNADLDGAWPAPDGGLVTVGGTVHAGAKELNPGPLITDGQTFWKRDWEDGSVRLKELNPQTGVVGRASWPSFVTPHAEKLDDLKIDSVWLSPLPEGASASPLGHRDGLCGYVLRSRAHEAWELTGIDGRTRRADFALHALVRFPGDTALRGLTATHVWLDRARVVSVSLSDENGVDLGTPGQEAWAGVGRSGCWPLSCWHFLSPRDEAGSAALRSATANAAQALLGGDAAQTARLVAQHLPAIQAPALREAVTAAALEATRLQQELARLVQERSPERAEALHHAPLADKDLLEAMGLLIERNWSQQGWTPDVVGVGRFLSGEPRSSALELSGLRWESWLHQVRALAVLAAAPFTGERERATLCSALATLRGTGCFDNVAQIRVAEVTFQKTAPILASGRVGFEVIEGSRCFVRPLTFADVESGAGHLVERSLDGTFRLPAGIALVSEQRLRDRGDAAFIERFLELMQSHAPAVPTRGPEQLISELTGLTEAESCLLFFGLSSLDQRARAHPSVKAMLEAIGLRAGEAKVAFDTFANISEAAWFELLDSAAPDDPAELFVPEVLARRLAEAWLRLKGKRVQLRPELVVAVERELAPKVASAALLEALLAPSAAPLLEVRKLPHAELFSWQQPTDCFKGPAIESFALLVAWAFAALPVGDPYRDALPSLHDQILARLNDPALALPLDSSYGEIKGLRPIFDAIGGELTKTEKDDAVVWFRDAGPAFAVLHDHPSYATMQAGFRPAQVADLAPDAPTWSLNPTGPSVLLASVAFLRSAACRRLVERIRQTPVPAGSYENDPAVSAPELVAQLQQRLAVSAEAARLYLQLLALPEPTNKNVMLWNGWKAPQLKKIGAELLAKANVVEGKRERAGRELFLPGGWERSTTKALPIEGWKASLYRLPRGGFSRILPVCAAHELFQAAALRLERGDVPKLEEV